MRVDYGGIFGTKSNNRFARDCKKKDGSDSTTVPREISVAESFRITIKQFQELFKSGVTIDEISNLTFPQLQLLSMPEDDVKRIGYTEEEQKRELEEFRKWKEKRKEKLTQQKTSG